MMQCHGLIPRDVGYPVNVGKHRKSVNQVLRQTQSSAELSRIQSLMSDGRHLILHRWATLVLIAVVEKLLREDGYLSLALRMLNSIVISVLDKPLPRIVRSDIALRRATPGQRALAMIQILTLEGLSCHWLIAIGSMSAIEERLAE